jgi:hypothetical protein
MKRKYFTPCTPEQEIDYYCVATEIIADDDSNNPTGSLEIEMIGGITPFNYTFTGPTFVINGVSQTFPQVQNPTVPKINDLYAGTYNVRVVDSIGNVSNCSFIIPGPTGVTCYTDGIDTTTFGGTDGKITINAQEGIPNYTYTVEEILNPTDNTPTLVLVTSGTFQSSDIVNGISAGTYLITVTDSGNIKSSCTSRVTIEEPNLPQIQVFGDNVLCYGKANGKAYATVTGGVNPGTWSWDNGQNSSGIVNLTPGTYTVTYTDASQQQVTGSVTIIEPSELTINISNLNNINCYQGSDGSFDAIIGGGTPPYDINIIKGTTTLQSLTNQSSGTYSISNLLEGWSAHNSDEYEVIVTDNNGCTNRNGEIKIKSPRTQLQPGTISISSPLKVRFKSVEVNNIDDCIFDSANSPSSTLIISVDSFNGGWGQTYNNYISTSPTSSGTGSPVGRYEFEVYYTDNGTNWTTTGIVSSGLYPNTTDSPITIVIPNTWSYIWGRQFKVKTTSYMVNPDGSKVIPETKCDEWANGVICIDSGYGVLTTTQITQCENNGFIDKTVSSNC